MSLPVVIGILLIYIAIVLMSMYDAKRKCIETFVWEPKPEEMEGLRIFDEEPNKEGSSLLIHSSHTLYHVKLLTNGGSRKVDFLKDILTDKEGIVLHIESAEGLTNHVLTCENEAYMQCQIPVVYNGRYGDVTLTGTYHFTWKSVVYFMLLGVAKYRA